MKKRVLTITLALFMLLTTMVPVSYADNEIENLSNYGFFELEEYTTNNNLGKFEVIQSGTTKTVEVGQVEAGKILIVSAIPSNGRPAGNYIKSISISPSCAYAGGWYSDSKMTYFKISRTQEYTLTISPSGTTRTNIEIYMYTVDAIDTFSKADNNGTKQTLSSRRSYAISNTPEMLGDYDHESNYNSLTPPIATLDLNEMTKDEAMGDYVSTTLVDGTERILPRLPQKEFVLSDLNNSKAKSVAAVSDLETDSAFAEIYEKVQHGERLSMKELTLYNDILNSHNLTMAASLSAIETNQLGEYGNYLEKVTVNGNANVYWEHVSLYGENMYFGVLIENTSNSDINVSLTSRNYDCTDISKESALTNVWDKYFRKRITSDKSGFGSTMTIPKNSAKWVVLYEVSSSSGYNIFNGQVGLNFTNSNGTTYTGTALNCYTFIMSEWVNPSGQTMYETVRDNIANGTFKRAAGTSAGTNGDNLEHHISGSGNGAQLIRATDTGVHDITSDRYSFILTGFDAPLLNSGENICLYHAGYASNTTAYSNYEMNPTQNYGVVYKIHFSGFTSSKNESIKLKLKYNRLSSPAAVGDPTGVTYVTLYCPTFSSSPYNTIVGGTSSDYASEKTVSWSINKNTPFDLYVVVSGMSNMPLELGFYAE